jgi:hypothetical protein
MVWHVHLLFVTPLLSFLKKNYVMDGLINDVPHRFHWKWNV